MLYRIVTLFFILLISHSNYSQQNHVPYEWDWSKDGTYTGATLIGSSVGFYFVINKDGITTDQLNSVLSKKNDINFLDRWAVGNSSETASRISDIPFYASFAAPMILFFDDEVNDNGGLVFGLFLKSMATTGTLYGLSAGLIGKSRPYVYSQSVDLDRRTSSSGQRSFFSGHTAATATATFFVAKVYQDFNPNSPGIPYVWAGAVILPAMVGYLRIEAGQHFLTDTIVGYTVGALSGFLVPHLNKKRRERHSKINLSPITGVTRFGEEYHGIGLRMSF